MRNKIEFKTAKNKKKIEKKIKIKKAAKIRQKTIYGTVRDTA